MLSIEKNSRFRQIYAQGTSYADRLLVLYTQKNSESFSRLGITVSSKVGGAVVRNKIKRRLKEIIRLEENVIKHGYDIIFIVRVRTAESDYWTLKAQAVKLLKEAGLLCDSREDIYVE